MDNRAGSVELTALDHWRAQGRLGVSGGEGGGSGSFVWDQTNARSVVQLSGPVGIGSVRLDLDGNALAIQTADGQRLAAQAALDELRSRLGADVPVEKLRYWMMGLAAPGPHRWLIDGTELEQDGWRITYQRFLEESGSRLPTKLLASSGLARVRVLVDRWELGTR